MATENVNQTVNTQSKARSGAKAGAKAGAKQAAKATVHVEPVHVEPAHVEPVHVEPAHVEPAHVATHVAPRVEPAHVEPAHVEPVHVEPVQTEAAEATAEAAGEAGKTLKPRAKRQPKKAAAKVEGEVTEKAKQPKKTECVGFLFNGIIRAKNVVLFQYNNVDQVNEYVKNTYFQLYGNDISGKYVKCYSSEETLTALRAMKEVSGSDGKVLEGVLVNLGIKPMGDLLKKASEEKEAHNLVLRTKEEGKALAKRNAKTVSATSDDQENDEAAEAAEADEELEEHENDEVPHEAEVDQKKEGNKKNAERKAQAVAHHENDRVNEARDQPRQKVNNNASACPKKAKQAQKTN